MDKPNYASSTISLDPDERESRLPLNRAEQEILRYKEAARQLLQGKTPDFPTALAKLGHPTHDKKEVRRLVKRYPDLFEAFCVFLVESYLDYTSDGRPDNVLAKRLGLSTYDLRNIKASETFKRIYGETMDAMREEPIVGLTRTRLPDLAPLWLMEVQRLMMDRETPATVKARLLTWYGDNVILRADDGKSSRDEWAAFLRDLAGSVTIAIDSIPDKYRGEIIDLELKTKKGSESPSLLPAQGEPDEEYPGDTQSQEGADAAEQSYTPQD